MNNCILIEINHFYFFANQIAVDLNQPPWEGSFFAEKELSIKEIFSEDLKKKKLVSDHSDDYLLFRIVNKNKFIFAAMKHGIQFSATKLKKASL
jgi:hypothetical protein